MSGVDPILLDARRSRRTRTALIWAALATLVLYAIPFGNLVLYPLMLFSTFVHEMGHGMTAVLLGGEFRYFKLWPDGSGLASYSGHFSSLDQAITAAGGLLGPAVLAALLFVLGRRTTTAAATLLVMAVVAVAADLWVVRNLFGFGYVAVVALVLGWIARKASPQVSQGVVVFLAIQLCASVFSRSDYLFTRAADTSGGLLPSDTEQIAQALGGPWWLWGSVVAIISLAILGAGLIGFVRSLRT